MDQLFPSRGRISVSPARPVYTSRELAEIYTPGVAEPVKQIAADQSKAYDLTGKGNLVAVISNGTAVLGLGNCGAAAAKPVMEGKAALFKRFAGIDAYDIEINSTDPDEIIRTVELLQPTFGGINLEDIKAPECIVIENELIKRMDIPVFHDDQHGTAVVACAGILNALKVAGKEIGSAKAVINGAGSAGLAVAHMLVALGLPIDHLTVCDSKGVIFADRSEGMNEYKLPFARATDARTLGDTLQNADIFIGVSKASALKPEMLKSMAANPIVFAMANPEPEIDPEIAKQTRPDTIMATGRSDYPNQVNNLLCFPFIFRGALDTRSKQINQTMKLAAIKAISSLARQPVPDKVLKAYSLSALAFGRDYLLPKPFDARLLTTVAPAVAQAAIESGAAGVKLDMNEYKKRLEDLAGRLG